MSNHHIILKTLKQIDHMNHTCTSCNASIPYNEPYVSMVYHIETASQNADGDIVVQVISADDISTFCQRCAVKNKPGDTSKYLKRIVKQNNDGSN